MSRTGKDAEGFTKKQRKFVAVWDGSAESTAVKAGYSKQHGRQMMCKAQYKHIQDAIAAKEKQETDELIADANELKEFWTRVLRGKEPKTAMKERLKASEHLGRSHGVFIEKHEHTGKDGKALFPGLTEQEEARLKTIFGGK